MKKLLTALFILNSFVVTATPLTDAVKQSSVTKVIELISSGADVNEADADGVYPVHYAVRENTNTDILKVLVDKGADLSKYDNDRGTVLFTSIKKDKSEFTKYLVRNGADVNQLSAGELPLNKAILLNQDQIVRYLISEGANVNLTDESGEHSLFFVFKTGNFNSDYVKLLKENEVDAYKLNNQGRSSFFFAIDTLKKVKSFTKQFTANFNLKDIDGITPLMVVASSRNSEVFFKGIELGGDITLKDNSKRNLLHYALIGSNKIVEYIFKQRFNPDEPNQDGFTPFLEMCKAFNNSYLNNLRSCIKHGCNINTTAEGNNSALIFIIKKGNYPEAVEYLLSAGANKDIINSEGKTALDIAIESDYSKIIELLRKTN